MTQKQIDLIKIKADRLRKTRDNVDGHRVTAAIENAEEYVMTWRNSIQLRSKTA